MRTLQTAFIFFITALIMLVFMPFGFLAFLGSLVGLKKPAAVLAGKIAQYWALSVVAISGCEITVRGREHIPREGAVCFVSNHGSIFDIILALAYIGRPFGFIAKKELLYIPLLNLWIAILGGLFIDRRRPRSALATINQGVARLRAGGGMLIFPEGRRSRGEGLLPFKSGSFRLATAAEAPIVPMSISGSYGVYEERGRLNPRPVSLVFSPLIPTKDLAVENRKRQLAEEVREVVARGLAGC